MKISAALGEEEEQSVNITKGSFALLYVLSCPDETRLEDLSGQLLNMQIEIFLKLILYSRG